MTADRFRPRLEEIENRITPAASPADVLNAAGTAAAYYNGTHAALEDQRFINLPTNRAPTKAVAAVIVQQSPGLANVLGEYVAALQAEKAAADPKFAGFFDSQIQRFTTLQNLARLAGIQAQAVSDRIDVLNTTTGTSGTGTGTTGTNTTGGIPGTTGVSGIGTGTGTTNTLPSFGGTSGTTTGGTNTGTTNGTNTGGTTTGSGTTTSGTGNNTGGTTGGTSGSGTSTTSPTGTTTDNTPTNGTTGAGGTTTS